MIDVIKAKRHYVMALAIMFVVVSLSGTTYSLFLKSDVTDDFTYNTGTLELQFIEDEQITIENAFPMIDTDGFNTTPYKLTIKNTGSLPYIFDLKMLSSTEENVINSKYIKFQVNDGKASTLYASSNIIASDILLYPEEEISFYVKVWLDISMPNSELGKTFVAKLATTGSSVYRTLDTSGANYPVINSDMIPVYYDASSDVWKKADQSNMIDSYQWYNYDDKMWANVVLIKDSNRKIYDITGNNDLEINNARTNSGNYVTDMKYLDIGLTNYKYNNISNIFRIKFNDLSDEKVYIISNDKMSYYYDVSESRFIFKVGNNIVKSEVYDIDSGKWYVLGYTYDSNVVSFYVDGIKLSSSNISGSISSKSFKIGTDNTFKELSNMEVGDIYIYNDILTSDEINTHYKTNISVLYDNLLVGYNDFVPRTLEEYYLSGDLGTVIRSEDISSFYVWVPRFKYKLWNVTGSSGIDSYDAYKKGIDIVFEKDLESSGVIKCQNNICYNDILMITKVTTNDNNKYFTHPAFTTSKGDVPGIWVSKYEVSTSDNSCNQNDISGCMSNELLVESKPGNSSWRNNYLSYFYQSIKNMGDNYYMIKNTDWGAVTYLAHSNFGLCSNNVCSDIGMNQTYISGSEINDSTTKNIYGIFDLSGGASEFMMSNYVGENSKLTLDNTHFENISLSEDEYELYHQNSFILGDATRELSLNGGIWYNNYNLFVNETNDWFIRGGIGGTSYKGMFTYSATTDNVSEYITTRVVIK